MRDIALDVFEEGDHAVLNPEFDVILDIGEDPVEVLADVQSLKEALKNLLNNALKYGRSPVRVGASLQGGRASIWVEDAGGGPVDGVLAELGSRFNKGALSRQSSSGLGLAIAHSVALSYDGELCLEKTGGARFRLPLCLQPYRRGGHERLAYRLKCLAAVVMLLATGRAVSAQELVEIFGPETTNRVLVVRSTTDISIFGPVVEASCAPGQACRCATSNGDRTSSTACPAGTAATAFQVPTSSSAPVFTRWGSWSTKPAQRPTAHG